VKAWLAYAAAAIVGIATPVLVLWLARSTPVGSDPALAGAAVVVFLAIVSGLLTTALPRHWLPLALIASLPLCVLGMVMFAALVNVGEFFWVWLGVSLGGVAASLLGAFLVARAKRA
jgi:hypothetical protein